MTQNFHTIQSTNSMQTKQTKQNDDKIMKEPKEQHHLETNHESIKRSDDSNSKKHDDNSVLLKHDLKVSPSYQSKNESNKKIIRNK